MGLAGSSYHNLGYLYSHRLGQFGRTQGVKTQVDSGFPPIGHSGVSGKMHLLFHPLSAARSRSTPVMPELKLEASLPLGEKKQGERPI